MPLRCQMLLLLANMPRRHFRRHYFFHYAISLPPLYNYYHAYDDDAITIDYYATAR